MSDDTRFTPRPGRIGDQGSGGGKRYTRLVLRRAARTGKVQARRPGSGPVRMRGAADALRRGPGISLLRGSRA